MNKNRIFLLIFSLTLLIILISGVFIFQKNKQSELNDKFFEENSYFEASIDYSNLSDNASLVDFQSFFNTVAEDLSIDINDRENQRNFFGIWADHLENSTKSDKQEKYVNELVTELRNLDSIFQDTYEALEYYEDFEDILDTYSIELSYLVQDNYDSQKAELHKTRIQELQNINIPVSLEEEHTLHISCIEDEFTLEANLIAEIINDNEQRIDNFDYGNATEAELNAFIESLQNPQIVRTPPESCIQFSELSKEKLQNDSSLDDSVEKINDLIKKIKGTS